MRKEDTKRTGTNSLQNTFTAYLLKAVRHKRQDYIKRQIRRQEMEHLQEEVSPGKTVDSSEQLEETLPPEMQLENTALLLALNTLNERERDILLSHVLNEESFDMLAAKYRVGDKTIAMRYYRTIRKIRKCRERK